MKEPFKFNYRRQKKCKACGKTKMMLPRQKTCDDCRRKAGKDVPLIPKRLPY